MNQNKIHLDLTVEETNAILEALGALPFARVYTLIGSIQEQARKQLDSTSKEASSGDNGRAQDESR